MMVWSWYNTAIPRLLVVYGIYTTRASHSWYKYPYTTLSRGIALYYTVLTVHLADVYFTVNVRCARHGENIYEGAI